MSTEMTMKGNMRLNVLGVSRFSFDGISGVKVYAQKETDGENEDVLGIEVVEFGGKYAVFEQFRGYGFPMQFDCEVEFARGSRGKAAVRVLKATPVKGQQLPPERKAA